MSTLGLNGIVLRPLTSLVLWAMSDKILGQLPKQGLIAVPVHRAFVFSKQVRCNRNGAFWQTTIAVLRISYAPRLVRVFKMRVRLGKRIHSQRSTAREVEFQPITALVCDTPPYLKRISFCSKKRW